MIRRNFLRSLAALIAAPALPAKALMAAPAPAASAAVPANLYTWSAMIARTQGRCSAEMLTKALHIDPTRAAGLMNKLAANNVVGAMNAAGLAKARAVSPLRSGTQAVIHGNPVEAAERATVKATDLLDAIEEPEEPTAEQPET